MRSFIASHPRCVFVEITEAKGSTPREAGAFMLVSETGIWGTIGGGQLEYMAIDNARDLMGGRGQQQMDVPLGPEIGQCCGGRIKLLFTPVNDEITDRLEQRLTRMDEDRPAVFLFGSGHVGHALANALAPLPLAVTVVETREDALSDLPGTVSARLVAIPEAEVAAIPTGGAAIILTHDHALDFLLAERALQRTDLAYIGMIGSATKRATFSRWLKGQGGSDEMLSRLVLPVGGSVVKDKRPEVIAAMVAAELLVAFAAAGRTKAGLQPSLPLDQTGRSR
jgi:xanthine dehydrogenase accessory factor